MKNSGCSFWSRSAAVVLALGCGQLLVSGQRQPVRIPQFDRSMSINSISNLRVGERSEDGTEITLVMHFSYNGRSGASARLVPVIDSSKQPGIGRWFGADMVTVPAGKGMVSIKVKFFNDEPGVPEAVESDRVRVLILNQSGSSIIGGKTLLKTVKWGRDDGSPSVPNGNAREEMIQLAAEAEERARSQARVAAEAETIALKQLEYGVSDQQKQEARSVAAANAKTRLEAEDRATEAALINKEQKELLADAGPVEASDGSPPKFKSRITNVEVVNRSRDRSRITLGIEFELKDKFGFKPFVGVKMGSSRMPDADVFFSSTPVKVSKRKKFVMIPVVFSPDKNGTPQSIVTDNIVVFVTDKSGGQRIDLDSTTVLLSWRAPGANISTAGTVVLEEFRQRNQHSGYAAVKYHLPDGNGRLRVRVFDSSKPESASWFASEVVPIESGRGLELVPVTIADNTGFPGGEVTIDTVEVALLGPSGQVVETTTRRTAIRWSREK